MNVPNSRCASWALARYTENLVIKREVYVDLLLELHNNPSERVLTETEVRDIAQKMNRILAFGRTESSNRAVREILALHGITL